MFDSCKFRMKEDLKRIEIIFDKLYSFLDNRELLRPIDIYLRDPLSNGYYIDFSSSNEVCLKNKHSKKDMVYLIVTPSLNNIESIAIKLITLDGRHEEEIIAQFKSDEEKVILTKREVEKVIQGRNHEVVSIKNNTSIKSFLHNKLRYNYEYSTETCFRIHQNYSKASLSEIFVDSDKSAVKRVACITEDEFYKDSVSITYYESNNYETLPFKDINCSLMFKDPMTQTTKEKFDEFISNQSKVVTLKR